MLQNDLSDQGLSCLPLIQQLLDISKQLFTLFLHWLLCDIFNAYHAGYKFQQTTFLSIFSYFPKNRFRYFMEIVSLAVK